MSPLKTLTTTQRVLKQLSHDPRTLALVLLVPLLLIVLLRYVFYENTVLFNGIAPMLLGIFPLAMMFLVTSIATLRERTSGTLDRLMTEPISKADFIFGYAIAFSVIGFIQASLASIVILGVFDVTVMGGTLPVLITAVSAAFLGTTLGLFVSVFARNEFQAVQLIMPILMPQILLCGLFTPRDQMAPALEWLSNVFPVTYSVDAMQQVAMHTHWGSQLTRDLAIILGCGIVALFLGAATIRRKE